MKLFLTGAAVALALIAGPANAATLIAGNNGLAEQIHSAGNQAAGTKVFGITQKSNIGVSLTSTSKLGINGSGYALITDADSNDNEVFDNFNLFLTTDPNGFTAVEFSIQYASQVLNTLGNGELTIFVDFIGGGFDQFGPIFFKNAGLFDYQIKAEGSQVIERLRLRSNIQFDMIKQNDITVAAAIPEPATWMMMLFGFGLIGGAMRRRKMVPSFA